MNTSLKAPADGSVSRLLNIRIPLPLSGPGWEYVGNSNTREIEGAIRFYEMEGHQDFRMAEFLKKVARVLKQHGRPVSLQYVPYIELAKLAKNLPNDG